MKEKVRLKVDTSEVDADINRLEQNLKSLEIRKNRLMSEIDNMEINDIYEERVQDLNERLNDFYNRIAETKKYIQQKKEEKVKIEQDKITGDTIYKNLMAFVRVLDKTTDGDKKRLYNMLIKEIQIFEEKQEDGRWIKSITFNFPVYYKGNMVEDISWVTEDTNETVVLLSKGEVDSKKIRVEFSLEDMDMSEFQDGATYTQIKDYVLEHSGLKVSNLYISQIKRKCGIEVGKNYNLPKSEDSRQPLCPPEKEKAIREAFKYFGII